MTDAPKIGKAFIEIRGDSSSLAKDAQSAGSTILAALKSFGPAIAGALGALKLGSMVKDAANLGDELNKMSQRVGISVADLASLKYAADLSGTSLQGMVVGVRNLSRATFEAAVGTKEYQDAFKQLGLDIRNTDGTLKDNNTLLGEIADKFQTMPDGAQKTALAMQLLGRSGTDMIPMLNQGRAGLEAARKEAEAFGLVIGKQFAQEAESFNDNLDRMGKIAQGVGLAIAKELIPALNRFLERIIEVWKQAGPSFLNSVRLGFEGVAKSVDMVGKSATNSTEPVKLLGQILGTIPLAVSGTFTVVYGSIAEMLEWMLRAAEVIDETLLTSDGFFQRWADAVDKRSMDALDNLAFMQKSLSKIWGFSKESETAAAKNERLAGAINNVADSVMGLIKTDPGKPFRNIADDAKKAGDMAALSGQQIWELIGALMRLSPTLAMAGLGHAVAAPTGGTYQTIGGAIGGIGGAIQRQFSNLGGLGPGLAPEFARMTGAGFTDFISLLFPGIESMGEFLQQYINAVAAVDVTPIETFGSAFTSAWSEISKNWQDTVAGMFSNAIIAGIQGGGKKMLKAIGQMFGQLVQMFGQLVIKWGIGTVALSLFPPNAAGIAKGMAQIAAGGALVAFGAMLGGGGGGGYGGGYAGGVSGSYYGNDMAATAPQPVNYTLGTPGGGSGTTVVNINALDAASFNDYLAKPGNSDAVAGAVVDAGRRNHPVRDHLNM